jgi:hypothetical protein
MAPKRHSLLAVLTYSKIAAKTSSECLSVNLMAFLVKDSILEAEILSPRAKSSIRNSSINFGKVQICAFELRGIIDHSFYSGHISDHIAHKLISYCRRAIGFDLMMHAYVKDHRSEQLIYDLISDRLGSSLLKPSIVYLFHFSYLQNLVICIIISNMHRCFEYIDIKEWKPNVNNK